MSLDTTADIRRFAVELAVQHLAGRATDAETVIKNAAAIETFITGTKNTDPEPTPDL